VAVGVEDAVFRLLHAPADDDLQVLADHVLAHDALYEDELARSLREAAAGVDVLGAPQREQEGLQVVGVLGLAHELTQRGRRVLGVGLLRRLRGGPVDEALAVELLRPRKLPELHADGRGAARRAAAGRQQQRQQRRWRAWSLHGAAWAAVAAQLRGCNATLVARNQSRGHRGSGRPTWLWGAADAGPVAIRGIFWIVF
jgi:hypothetical protein